MYTNREYTVLKKILFCYEITGRNLLFIKCFKMPRQAAVKEKDFIEAVCQFKHCLINGQLPAYSDQFYSLVSNELKNKCTTNNIYTTLRENRRGLRTKIFKELQIEEKIASVQKDFNFVENSTEFPADNEKWESEVEESLFSISFSKDKDTLDLCIPHKLWHEIKPTPCTYEDGREYLVLKRGVWTDIISDEYWKQYRMPCAFTFKKNFVSRNPEEPFLIIKGRCKSTKCNNKFVGTINREPLDGADVWMKVESRDTRTEPHDELKRQLRFIKRQVIGQQVIREGAANFRRKLAVKEQNIGDVEAPILYKNDVLRKLAQECKDKEIGVDPKDGNNPVLILQKLKHMPSYAGTIRKIGLEPFIVIYILPEQIFLFKEYSRLMKFDASVCIDSTASLVLTLDVAENVKSPTIFLFEIVINFLNVTASVGQMLSSAQDTNTILYFLNDWLKQVGITPKEAVSDYSRALLAAKSLSYNCLPLKDYIRNCFLILQDNGVVSRPAPTFIRVDVAHFIAIFCRLKCFTPDKKPIKDFFIRCMALLVSCEEFERFEEILLLTLTVSIQAYDGKVNGSDIPSPAELARLQLLQYIASEQHRAMKLVPDESKEEFKTILQKLSSTGISEENPSCFLNEEPDSDVSLTGWVAKLKQKAEQEKDAEHERANAYYLPQFYHHLLRVVPEFVLWTAVMRKYFKSSQIRATSCFVEGDFGELKNGVLKGVHRALRVDKLFRIHFLALRGQILIASAAITAFLMEKKSTKTTDVKEMEDEAALGDSTLLTVRENQLGIPMASSSPIIEGKVDINAKSEYPTADFPTVDAEAQSFSNTNCQFPPNSDLYERENWRNKGAKEDVLLTGNVILSDLDKNTTPKTSRIRMLKPPERKPSKYFKPCPDIKIQQNAAVVSHCKFSGKPNKWLLKNGCLFSNPIEVQNQMYFIKYTCPFDAIVQILAAAAMDHPEYYDHLERSKNLTCEFLFVFIDSGAIGHVYVQRCFVLKDFVNPLKPTISHLMYAKKSPKILRSVEVDCNVVEMWAFLMKNEPSIYVSRSCQCGYIEVMEVSSLYLKNKIIEAEGFSKLESAIFYNLDNLNTCECGLTISEEISVNPHVLIEADVRKTRDLKSSLMCSVTDFPKYISLFGEKLRLVGIIIHTGGNHYEAVCKRSNNRWELYDDMKNDVPFFDVKKKVYPSAVIYIKITE